MKRITPQEVVDAYIATGMYRSPRCFTDYKGGGCALFVLNLARTGKKGRCESILLAQPLGVDPKYALYFSAGFDGALNLIKHIPDENDACIGYLDGQASLAAVEEHFAAQPARATEPTAELVSV